MDFLYQLKKLKRGPAIMLQKDIGIILAYTNIDRNSKVLDAGSGTGVLTCFLARFCKRVYSYDNRKEFLELAKENANMLGLKNITFRHQDIFESIPDKNLDLITLDLKDAEKALQHCHTALKQDGYLTAYLPNISQVQEFVLRAKQKFKIIKVLETIERPWIVEERRLRPENVILGHTGFVVILKKH